MNKTVNINLAGIFFHIDEEAYLKLSRYLEAIKRSFTDSQGQSEIIADIEARIAELFSEKIQNETHVVNNKLVDDVITIMGQPEDYLVDDEIFEDNPQPHQNYQNKNSKKLYRDTDNSYVGGVAAGLSHFIGLDALWLRIIWVILTLFSGGTFVLIYLIFWALVPEAKTTAEKLIMTGDPVNISNIEKKIKDGFNSVTDTVKNVDLKKQGEKIKEGFENVSGNISDSVKNVDLNKQGNRIKSSSQNFFDSIASIFIFFLKVFAKFIGVIMVITGISTLLALIIGFFTIGITNAYDFPGKDFLEASNLADLPIWLMAVFGLLAIGIPFFFVFYLGLKILLKNLKSIGNIAKYTLLGLWLASTIGIIFCMVSTASEHAFDARVTSAEVLNISKNDTLKIRMSDYEDNYISYYSRHNIEIIEDEYGKKIESSDLRLIVRSTKEPVGKIIIEREASGRSYKIAKDRAENIKYNYTFNNNELVLERRHISDIKNKLSDQEVRVIVYIPEGATVFADSNTYYFHRNSSYYNDILINNMEDHYLRVEENDMTCLDCETDDDGDDENDNDEQNTKQNKSAISIDIDDEEGVNIQLNNN